MIYFDLHNHTNNSRDGSDPTESVVTNAISAGLQGVGITDHNYWVSGRFDARLSEINALREKYRDKIKVFSGMEIALTRLDGMTPQQLCGYDYCLLEAFNSLGSFAAVCEYARTLPCRCGLAHTDIFALSEATGEDVPALMAENNIFWELNVNYDTIHGFREHEYCRTFMNSEHQQHVIRSLGIELSVGFDTHSLADYRPERVRAACEFIASHSLAPPSFTD